MNGDKWIKITAVTGLILALVAIIGEILIYKKIGGFNGASYVPAQENAQPTTNQIQQNAANESKETAFGFLGFPISKLVKEGDLSKFKMKGHWLLDKDVKFDYINKTDNIQTEIQLDKNTKIKVFESQIVKNGARTTKEKEISLSDFSIDSFNQPFLVVFPDSVIASPKTVLAKEIKVYPKIP